MDNTITQEALAYTRHSRYIKIVSNTGYTYQDIAGILELSDLHVGMRTHSLILASAVLTPTVSINAYPKNAGFMQSIKQEKWTIDFSNFTVEKLTNLIITAWSERESISQVLAPIIELEKEKARQSAAMLKDYLS